MRARGLLAHAPELPARVRELFVGTEDREPGVRSQAEGRRVFAFDPTRLITERMHPLWAIDDLRRVVGAAIWMHRRMNLLP